MKLFKITNKETGEKIEVTPEVSIFENVNTHSGDIQEVLLSVSKDETKNIKDLMCELSIVENDETYKLKKSSTDDDSVFYYRTLTGKTISFKLFIRKDSDEIILKPDKDGVYYIEKNWVLNEEISLKLVLNCEENFSEKFSENKILSLEINFLGDENENKSESFI